MVGLRVVRSRNRGGELFLRALALRVAVERSIGNNEGFPIHVGIRILIGGTLCRQPGFAGCWLESSSPLLVLFLFTSVQGSRQIAFHQSVHSHIIPSLTGYTTALLTFSSHL